MYNSKIIIALDFKDRITTLAFLDKFAEERLFVKIGMELFYKEGPSIVKEISEKGHNIFLDLKLYDIPTTVCSAVKSLGEIGVDFLTIHTSGGEKMLTLANKVAKESNINLLGVTILTSQDVTELPKTDYSQCDVIVDLAQKAMNANLSGIICSGEDIPILKDKVHDLLYITPGIRLSDDSNDDQKRVVTPKTAILNGSDYLVIGRSITNSKNPYQTYKEIQQEIGER